MNRVWRVVRTIVRRKRPVRVSGTRQAYLTHREYARGVISGYVAEYAKRYGLVPRRIAIRHTTRRWGSCSAAGNVNFSYKLAFLPPCLARYIVVHELCHLEHLHHRASFWQAVADIMPDYAIRVGQIRTMERTTGVSLTALAGWSKAHDAVTCVHCVSDAVAEETVSLSQDSTELGQSDILSVL